MALQKILTVTGKAVSIPSNDVDTDRIIPARFLKCVTFDGLGRYAFYDERFDEDGTEKPHPLNDPKYKGSSILISGSNFGCGSSRGPLAFHGNLPGYAREAFLQGKWDPIVDLLEGIPLIRKIAAKVSRF
ncbi:MAG: hypothetical protein JMM75_01995 [Candidatus Xiphinematobacter sp.]|nr:MAG: hypothetical protein JMM75_01995 [Candidatus Xiphinematobacter sp.]